MLLPGVNYQPVVVSYTAEDGTAVRGTDYALDNGDLAWEAGDNASKVAFPSLFRKCVRFCGTDVAHGDIRLFLFRYYRFFRPWVKSAISLRGVWY